MPADYARIANDNLVYYGTGAKSYFKLFYSDLYSDRTHFLFEILQNTEDALNRRRFLQPDRSISGRISFRLFEDRLEIRHFGIPFSDEDVRSICAVAESTKSGDTAQIGRFGVGFKAVFNVTDSPAIHSGDQHFEIRNLVQPHAIDAIAIRDSETVIVLPFNRIDRPANEIFEMLSSSLTTFEARTLLFLSAIDEIDWQVAGGASGNLSRVDVIDGEARFAALQTTTPEKSTVEEWLVYRRSVDQGIGGSDRSVQIAFSIQDADKKKPRRIVRAGNSYLHVFFPTTLATKLGFLVHGPFHTNVSRETIDESNAENRALVEQAGELLFASLADISERGLVSVDMWRALPLYPANYNYWPNINSNNDGYSGFFGPMFSSTLRAAKQHSIIPAASGRGVTAHVARLADVSWLREAFDVPRLRAIEQGLQDGEWIDDQITSGSRETSAIYYYYKSQVNITEYTITDILEKCTPEFLEAQSDEWLLDFYRRIRPNVFVSSWFQRFPLLRLESGDHVCLQTTDGQASAYLPPAYETSLPTIKRKLAEDPGTRELFVSLQLRVAEAADELQASVIRKYPHTGGSPVDIDISLQDHLGDMEQIVRVLEGQPEINQLAILRDLQRRRCVRAVNFLSGEASFKAPEEVYVRSPKLECYFAGNPAAWFLDGVYPDQSKVEEILRISKDVRITRGPLNWEGHVVIRRQRGRHTRGLRGFDPNLTIDGLEYVLSHPSPEAAQVLWNDVIAPQINSFRGTVETSRQETFRQIETSTETRCQVAERIAHAAWLPSASGALVAPNQIAIDELPDGYVKKSTLAEVFDMVGAIKTPSRPPGWSDEEWEFFLKNPGKMRQFIDRLIKEGNAESRQGKGGAVTESTERRLDVTTPSPSTRVSSGSRPPGEEPHVAYGSGLERISSEARRLRHPLDRPGATTLDIDLASPRPLTDPQHRYRTALEGIRASRAMSAPNVDAWVVSAESRPSGRIPGVDSWITDDGAVQDHDKVDRERIEAAHERYRTAPRPSRFPEEVIEFLYAEYVGRCQICDGTFAKWDGRPYFEAVHFFRDPSLPGYDSCGNAFCLCADCAARYRHGNVSGVTDPNGVLMSLDINKPDGDEFSFVLCDKRVVLRLTQPHVVELRAVLEAIREA